MKSDRIDSWFKYLAAALAIITGVFHLINVGGIVVVSDMTLRAVHVMAMLAIMFLNIPANKTPFSKNIYPFRLLGTAASLTTGVYILLRWKAIIESGGMTNSIDTYMGILMVSLLLFCTWVSIGKVLTIVISLFLLYPFVGPYLVGILQNRAFSIDRTFSFIYASTQGIYGIPISVSASYIVMFCIYGAFLNQFGAGEFLFKLSASLTSKLIAATAKTAIVFSALIGMISGSAAGNVAIAGSIAIPMMKKRGYNATTAGAIEAVAATGGQIMPPIMGAAAFIMAEMTGVSYVQIMKAAAIPAVLYFLSLFFIVHLTAQKERVDLNDGEQEIFKIGTVLKEGWYFALPIIMLLVMLVMGFSPFKSAYYSIFALLLVYIIAKRDFSKGFGMKILEALRKGVVDTVPIAVACAASGIIVSIINMTGIGNKLTTLIVTFSDGRLFVALILTMVVSIILGMGLPTTAVYLVVATVVAPALTRMGLPVLAAHLFVFFFGCISTITPPVALASYVAAGVADAKVNDVGWTAFRYGIISFLLPFMFVYGPALLMEGSLPSILITLTVAIAGVYAVAVSIVGSWRSRLVPLAYRMGLFFAGILLVNQGYLSDAIGILLCVLLFAMLKIREKAVA